MDKVIKEVESATGELVKAISSFTEEQINTIPFEGSWTPGQVAQHLIMANSGFTDMLNGDVKDTERKPDEMIEKIKKDFLNFNVKYESPDFILPPEQDYNKAELISTIQNIGNGIAQAAGVLDLTKTCMGFELPVYGRLTRLEAIYFYIYHTQRHTHQLKEIYRQMGEKR